MKKNKTMRIASVVMMAALLSTCAISGTFAKYTSASTGKDTARVAKWDIRLGQSEQHMTDEFTFDLFNTTYDNGAVKSAGTDNVIAPGTTGSFVINIQNKSEVAAKYWIDFTETKTDMRIPLQYSTNNTKWETDINKLDIKQEDAVVLAIGSDEVSVTIYWKWDFNGAADSGQTDETDTELGVDGTDTVTVTAKVTAEQVD
jgi:hypothetical protein